MHLALLSYCTKDFTGTLASEELIHDIKCVHGIGFMKKAFESVPHDNAVQ